MHPRFEHNSTLPVPHRSVLGEQPLRYPSIQASMAGDYTTAVPFTRLSIGQNSDRKYTHATPPYCSAVDDVITPRQDNEAT